MNPATLYAPLPDYARDAPPAGPSHTEPEDFLPNFVLSTLPTSTDPVRIFEQRVRDKPVMLDNNPTSKEKRDERKRKRRGKKGMSARERRAGGMRKVPRGVLRLGFCWLRLSWRTRGADGFRLWKGTPPSYLYTNSGTGTSPSSSSKRTRTPPPSSLGPIYTAPSWLW